MIKTTAEILVMNEMFLLKIFKELLTSLPSRDHVTLFVKCELKSKVKKIENQILVAIVIVVIVVIINQTWQMSIQV